MRNICVLLLLCFLTSSSEAITLKELCKSVYHVFSEIQDQQLNPYATFPQISVGAPSENKKPHDVPAAHWTPAVNTLMTLYHSVGLDTVDGTEIQFRYSEGDKSEVVSGTVVRGNLRIAEKISDPIFKIKMGDGTVRSFAPAHMKDVRFSVKPWSREAFELKYNKKWQFKFQKNSSSARWNLLKKKRVAILFNDPLFLGPPPLQRVVLGDVLTASNGYISIAPPGASLWRYRLTEALGTVDPLIVINTKDIHQIRLLGAK